jgi:hypothetical protein
MMATIGTVIVVTFGLSSNIIGIASVIVTEHRIRERTRKAFERETRNSERVLKPKLRGIPSLLPRDEPAQIIEQIELKKAVLVTGEAGTGKSGIAVALVKEARKRKKFPLLLDARRLVNCENYSSLREYFDINEPFVDGIEIIGKNSDSWIIVDQLDNIAGLNSCTFLVGFLIACSNIPNTKVVVLSRHQEANERGALRPLLEAGFVEIQCMTLRDAQIIKVFADVNVSNISADVLQLARNLLNLDLLCEIAILSNLTEISNINDNIDLWERYTESLRERENESGDNKGDVIFEEAIRLAQIGLNNINRTFELGYSPTENQRRLISNGIIYRLSELKFQFRHEKLQDYLYAQHACNRGYLTKQVFDEINSLHTRNILVWMTDIYQQRNSPEYGAFLEETIDG